jgi:hypothetical protein
MSSTPSWSPSPSSTPGEQYERGDRLSLRHRWVRRVVAEQPDLEKRYAKQEGDPKKREKQAREERKREEIERAVELQGGFHLRRSEMAAQQRKLGRSRPSRPQS